MLDTVTQLPHTVGAFDVWEVYVNVRIRLVQQNLDEMVWWL